MFMVGKKGEMNIGGKGAEFESVFKGLFIE